MELIKIEAKPRESGKRAAKDARQADEVPCVIYGSETETQVFQIPELILRPLIYTNEFRRVEIKLGKKKFECILKNVDFDPVSDRPIHADFQTLITGQLLTLNVPVHFEGNSLGVLDGGTPQEFLHEVSIRCLPKDIPDHIAVDITALDIGDSILIRDLDIEGVVFNVPDDQAVISIIQPREIIEPVVELEDELEEGAEGVEEGAEITSEGEDATAKEQ